MDDILKRMMEAEAEAEEIVKAANAEGDRLRSEARREANLQLAEAQKSLATETEQYVSSRLSKAHEEEKAALQEGDSRMREDLAEYERRFARHTQEVAELLLYPSVP